MLEKENEVRIAEISWLSRKDLPKAYGSMVVYMTKRAEDRTMNTWKHSFKRTCQPLTTRTQNKAIHTVECSECGKEIRIEFR